MLPLRLDSIDWPEILTERSPERMGSGAGGGATERGVCVPLIGMSRDLPLEALDVALETLDEIDVARERSTSKPREETGGSMGCDGARGEAYVDGRPLRSRDDG